MAKQVEVTLTRKADKTCKHTVVFENRETGAALSSVYVSKSVPGIEQAKSVVVTIEPMLAA